MAFKHWLHRRKISGYSSLFQYHEGPQSDTSGAEFAVLQPNQSNNPIFLNQGSGIVCGAAPRAIEGAQVYVLPTVPTDGFGGVTAGQLVTQGLILGNNDPLPPF